MNQVYSVIGNNRVPDHYNELMNKLAKGFKKEGYKLRTRGRMGIEEHAMSGACYNKTVIPGNNWRQNPVKEAYDIAWDWSPRWLRMSEKQQRRIAYLVQVLLGESLNERAKFLITYSEDKWTSDEVIFATRLAREYHIPVFDLAEMDFYKLWTSVLNTPLCTHCSSYDGECNKGIQFKVEEKDIQVLRFYDLVKNKYDREIESCGIDGKWFEDK